MDLYSCCNVVRQQNKKVNGLANFRDVINWTLIFHHFIHARLRAFPVGNFGTEQRRRRAHFRIVANPATPTHTQKKNKNRGAAP